MQSITLEEYSRKIAEEAAMMIGREEGKSEGMMIGMEKGKSEGKFEVARSMLADGFPLETIKKHTGLDERSILSL
jgi:predicted transposase/invertase (TIGR01784 family)